MAVEINALRKELAVRGHTLSHVGVANNSETVCVVDGMFISPEDAQGIARGSDTIDDLRARGDLNSSPTDVAFLAAVTAVTPAAKLIYDVTKDGWAALKPSQHLSIAILNSESHEDGHVVTVSVTNLTPSGLYIDSVSIAKSLDKTERESPFQPTVKFQRENGMNNITTRLPILVSAHGAETCMMYCPVLRHKGKVRTYGVADLHYSKLDEPAADYVSFTFRLR
jgi:hypothetical protein